LKFKTKIGERQSSKSISFRFSRENRFKFWFLCPQRVPVGWLGRAAEQTRAVRAGVMRPSSWVGSRQNQPVSPGKLGSALGSNIIKALAQKSGLSEDELTKQRSQVHPIFLCDVFLDRAIRDTEVMVAALWILY
jgi:hypothetical protein